MKRILRWFFVGAAVVALTACGGGSGSGDNGGSALNNGNNAVQTRTVIGYVEDDPIPNAKILVKDKDDNLVAQATADSNGKYTLEGAFKDGTRYTLESVGILGDRNITLHSVFRFSNDTVINANPITELKYKLVQSGKSLDEAEKLIRDYFSIVSGEKLEQNRFYTQDSVAIGMTDLAKLYDGKLPVDAIEKIKEDILRNASLEIKDYLYRSMLQKKIDLQASSDSMEVGQDVNVTIVGIGELNKNYMIKWSGFDGSQSEENKTNVSFTVSMPQDVYVKAAVYKRDGNRTKFIASAESVLNFYKTGIERNITIENASIDNNFTIGESSITVPAGTLSEGQTIRVVQRDTGSDKKVAEFEIDTSGIADRIFINYKYDPTIIPDPRLLVATAIINGRKKVLNTVNIDYSSHIVKYEIETSASSERSIFNNHTVVNIERISSPLSKGKILDFSETYKSYFEDILKKYLGEGFGEEAYNALMSDEYISKMVYVLNEKESGDYKFNFLAASLNNIIAYKKAQNLFATNNEISWKNALYDYACSEYKTCNYRTSSDTYTSKLVDINKVIAPFVGSVKLTPDQANFIKNAKLATNLAVTAALTVASGGTTATMTVSAIAGIGGSAIDYAWPSDLGPDATGYAYSVVTDVAQNASLVEIAQNLVIEAVLNSVFQQISDNMIEENAVKTAPIFLSLAFNYNNLPFSNLNQTKAPALTLDQALDVFFPDKVNVGDADGSIKEFYDYYRNVILCVTTSQNNDSVLTGPGSTIPEPCIDTRISNSQFGSAVDPNGRLDKLFLKSRYGEDQLSEESRALAYHFLKFAYGESYNTTSSRIIKNLVDASEFKVFQYLVQILSLPDSYVQESIPEVIGTFECIGYGGPGTTIDNPYYSTQCPIYGKTLRIKSEYDITTIDHIKNFFGITRSINGNSESLTTLKSYENFEYVMNLAKLKLTDEQIDKLKIKKIKVELYGIGLTFNEDDNVWELDQSIKEQQTYIADGDINSKFVYDSEYGKNVLTFAELFANEDFSLFDNKLVGMKVSLVYEKNGVEKVSTGSFVFSTVSDEEHVEQADYKGATLKSSIKDAVTGQPIENAQVTIIPGGLTDFTDENGNYVVNGLAAGKYTIVVSKVGYKQVEAELDLQEDETKVYEASLAIDEEHATDVGGANITLKDALTGDIITNGYIKVRKGQNNKTGEVVEEIINSDGNSSINLELMPNVYTVEVGANGYNKSFNTITVIGGTNSTYEFTISPVLPENRMRIVLTWGENPSDLDSHLVRLSGNDVDYHVFYADMQPSNADANLDVDDTTSYGPETITISNLDQNKTYKYYVHDFSNGSDHNDTALKSSGAKVEVYYGDQSKTFYVPNENGNAWKVFEIVNGEIVPCVDGCIFGVDSETDAGIGQRALDKSSIDRRYFKNLPAK